MSSEWTSRGTNTGTSSVTRLGNLLDFGPLLLKPLATIKLPKSSSTFLGNFCKDVKIYHSSIEIIFGQLL